MRFTVIYGIESQEKESIQAPTVGQVKRDTVLKAVLGFGDNVRALVNGVEQPDDTLLYDGAEVVLETKANTKAYPLPGLAWKMD